MYPEGGFKEFKTHKLVKDTLLSFGYTEEEMIVCAQTGLYVNLKGKGEESQQEKVMAVALRADMDGLPIPENNKKLKYTSKTDYAHMCGHDGHTATLLATAKALIQNRDKIPKNKMVRLLFQPAEEGPGGAKPMIEEGCLENIDEVYGFHNVPNFDEGDIRVCHGAIFADSISVSI